MAQLGLPRIRIFISTKKKKGIRIFMAQTYPTNQQMIFHRGPKRSTSDRPGGGYDAFSYISWSKGYGKSLAGPSSHLSGPKSEAVGYFIFFGKHILFLNAKRSFKAEVHTIRPSGLVGHSYLCANSGPFPSQCSNPHI